MKTLILACTMSLTLIANKYDDLKLGSQTKRYETCGARNTQNAFVEVAKDAKPAVVFLRVEGQPSDPYQGQNPFDSFQEDEFFRRFFGAPPPQQRRAPPKPQMSQGSGFFVTSDGYIMTNAHVVRDAVKITAVLNDGTELDATLIGTDNHTDLAVVKVSGENHPFVKFADMDNVEVGEWAIAIGSPFQLEATVTVGVVSAKGRNNLHINDLEDFIQTDAAINPGNSGGPLLDIDGKVIGVNAAIVSRSGGYMGIGFAIPCNMAEHVMDQLIHNGTVDRGFMGVHLQPLDKNLAEGLGIDQTQGAIVAQVVADSPAAKAGLKTGDVIIAYNNRSIKSASSLRNDIAMLSPGTVVNLTIKRQGKTMNLPVTLGSRSQSGSEPHELGQKIGLEASELTPELRRRLRLSPSEEGVVITQIKQGSPAMRAGLQPGFLIVSIGNYQVTNIQEFNQALAKSQNQKSIAFLVQNGPIRHYYTVSLQ